MSFRSIQSANESVIIFDNEDYDQLQADHDVAETTSFQPIEREGSIQDELSIRNSQRFTQSKKYGRTFHFKSSLIDGPVEKPWLNEKDHREKWAIWIPYIGIIVGIMAFIGIGITAIFTTPRHNFCLVFEDNFDGDSINADIWQHEVQLNGFGNGEFDWTTSDPRNSYVKNGELHIVPTLTNASGITDTEIYNGYTVNLTSAGTCTSLDDSDCSLTSNITTGSILPPIQSARLTTKSSHSIRYGKVEVVAKMPAGDWLWPAIWMLPVNNTYGEWPKSGEIDIIESRGNKRARDSQGRNFVGTALHWGPNQVLDRYTITNRAADQPLSDFSSGYHTFGMEWTDKYFYTWIDSPLRQIFYYEWPLSLWQVGRFPSSYGLDPLYDLWKAKTAPFDQEFFLILNVAVGGINGYFPDNVRDKPWINSDSVSAKYHFYQQVNSWLPSWFESGKEEDRGMSVKSVKMWKLCD